MSLGPLTEVTVASRDVAAAVGFCSRGFELEVLEEGPGGTVLGAALAPHGRVRHVEADADPGHGHPRPWELGPRVLGIRPRDVHASSDRLRGVGAEPTAIASYEVAPGSTTIEYWVDGPDDVTWEVPLSARVPSVVLDAEPERGHTELIAVAVTTRDVAAAVELFAHVGGMTVLGEGLFSGPTFETFFGFSPEVSVKASVLTSGAQPGMLLELWEFVGIEPIEGPERPVGIQRISFLADDPAALGARLAAGGAEALGGDRYRAFGVEIELRDSGAAAA